MSVSAKQEHTIAILSFTFNALLTIFTRAVRDNFRIIHSQMKKLLYDKNKSPHVKCKEFEKLVHRVNDIQNIEHAISILQDKHDLNVENQDAIKMVDIGQTTLPNRTIQNMKDKLEYLTFGYINQKIEHQYNLNIPFYLKMICLQYYGNIIMKSKILNTYQTNIIAYSLTSILTNVKYFYPKLIYDSINSGFDSKLFDFKCKNCIDSLIIIKTNENDIFCMFKKPFKSYGFLLHTSFKSPPILHNIESTIYLYHFENDFTLNASEKLADIFTTFNEDISVINRIGTLQKKKININLCIAQFEVFLL